MQQASGSSGVSSTYDPYLLTLVTEVKALCPDARLMWHMTWAYQGNSANGNATLGTNMKNYAATRIFTKDEIPNGSLIVQKEGHQYRPEGWSALDVKTNPRPGNVLDQLVVVDDAWWREFNFRAFNLALAGNPKLNDEQQEELKTAFAIFVPEN